MTVGWAKSRVVELRAECKRRGLTQDGLKSVLVARLEDDDAAHNHTTAHAQAHADADARTTSGPKESSAQTDGIPLKNGQGSKRARPIPGALRSLVTAMFVGTAAVAAGLWSQVPPPRDPSVYEAALQEQTAARQNMTNRMVERSERMAAEIASRMSEEGGAESVLLAKEPFDVVVSGGGFRGQYAGGVLSILQLLEQRGLINIKRWAGSSIGACTAAHFASGNDFESFFKVRRFASLACGVASSLHCTLSPSMGPARPP
mmetsp:Transcript_10849/g.28955  ORF Transcript_10849/g.28955 Transcript_10849/m.28955 type:complete len:260 (-) Transcript_10849:2083-2862(-)